jgi:hypothetical protein
MEAQRASSYSLDTKWATEAEQPRSKNRLFSRVSKMFRDSFSIRRRARASDFQDSVDPDQFDSMMMMFDESEEHDYDENWKISGSGSQRKKRKNKERKQRLGAAPSQRRVIAQST